MIEEKNIITQKTARYYTCGTLNKNTKQIWFICHGYGQNALNMIKKFQQLTFDNHYIVAPEALSRFYWKGFGGKPVASWMTSADRQHEIDDYVFYLNKLYQLITKNVPLIDVEVNVLGFSQGTATASRWVVQGNVPCKRLILWAGAIAHDLNWLETTNVLQHKELYWVYGDQDPFISNTQIDAAKKRMYDKKIKGSWIKFEGKHEIHQATLLTLGKQFLKNNG